VDPPERIDSGKPPIEGVLWVKLGAGPSMMHFGDPELQRLYKAVFGQTR
jgi:hypothetical protein